MKAKIVILCFLGCVLALSVGYESSWAKSGAGKSSSNIGVVSIRRIFQDCKRIAKYREESLSSRDRLVAELGKLSKEIESERAGLRVLKTGSGDYLAQMKEILEKQANLQVQEEFHKQQIVLEEKSMIEELYKDILRETAEVAKQKGLYLVFEKSEPELPALSSKELSETISTHKLLYSGGCLDITDEVMARLDSEAVKR